VRACRLTRLESETIIMSEVITRKQALPAPALPRENFVPIKECRDLGQLFSSADFRERIVASVPKHMTSDRILSVVLRAHMTNPLLLRCTPQSFAGACLTATNTGLEPNSPLAEAHLIPFKQKIRAKGDQPEREVVQIQTIFGFQGLLKLATNTGRVLSVSANVVYPDSDIFDWMEGSETYLRFKRGGRRERRDGDQPGYAYFHGRLMGGGESMEVWPWGEVLKIRNMSQAYRHAINARAQAEAKKWRVPLTYTEAPWVKWEEPMARKTMIRAGVKYLPKSVELALASRIDELGERRTIDYSRVIDLAGNAAEPSYADAAVTLGEDPPDPDPSGGPGAGGGPRGGSDPDPDDGPAWDDDDPGYSQGGPSGSAGGADGGAGATFADRRPVENRTDQQTPTGGAERQQVRSPSFEAYLIGPDGEVEGDVFVDPVAWARAFLDLGRGASPAQMMAMLEHNEDALAEARQAPIADQLLAVRDEARDLPSPSLMILGKTRDGKPDWKNFVGAFRDVLFGWRGDLAAWLDVQRHVITQAPLAQRLLLVKAIRERGDQLKAGLPEWVLEMTGRPEQRAGQVSDQSGQLAGQHPSEGWSDPGHDPDGAGQQGEQGEQGEPIFQTADERQAYFLVKIIRGMTNIEDIQNRVSAQQPQELMRKLRHANPALFASTEAAINARIEEVRAGQSG
jgi:recombination protein RecT